MYSPTLGRFMQTDPIGYADGMNWYAYVGGDPVNYVDPLGLASAPPSSPDDPRPLPRWFDCLTNPGLPDCDIVVNGDALDGLPGIKSSIEFCPRGVTCFSPPDDHLNITVNQDILVRAALQGGGRGGANSPDPCRTEPNTVNFSGTAAVVGIGYGGVELQGTFRDVHTGREWSIFARSLGGSLGFNIASLSGTLGVSPSRLAEGFSLTAFAFTPLGFDAVSGGAVQTLPGSADSFFFPLDVSLAAPGLPIASFAINFRNVTVRQTSTGRCRR